MNIYKARYNNALKWANKINSLLAKGCLVFHQGYKFNGFIIDDIGSIYEKGSDDLIRYLWFSNGGYSNGGEMTISEYNKAFDNFSYVHPKHVRKLKKG